MITIVNISPKPKPFGVHEYSLRINDMEICRFEHTREDGLAACLLAAAKKVTKSKWLNAKHIIFKSDLKFFDEGGKRNDTQKRSGIGEKAKKGANKTGAINEQRSKIVKNTF